ncbi:uncharacterized protein J3D65DRAFT_418568 [Phyllosticta citribraziliensis]|uniref:Uncharacterized protein n=1 Tax=Phyllosticta citribraziliensis TaxID=989973 RepID=A0ABR1LML8_9PEZI
MPSAQLAASANGVLERSSRDSSLFRAHKPLSRKGDFLRLPGAFPQTTSWNDDSCTDFSDDSTPIGSPLQNGPESGLPPTPPSHETQRPPSAVDVTDGVVAKRPSLRTPINQRSPPTPEPSPPRRPEYPQAKLQPPPTLRYPSSRAESFTTAKSHLGSDDDVSLGSYYDALTPVQQIVIKAKQTQDMSFGLGLHLEAGDDVTPTERNPFGRSSNNTWETSNGGTLKNGTVRPLASRPPHSISVTKRGQNPREHEDGKRLSKSPGLEKFAREIGWTSDALDDTTDSKRLSSTSTTSTVVEAVVVSTSTDQKRQLRHAGKNLAFRHTSDTTADRPSPRRSHRMPVNGVDHTHRLLHHYDRIPDRKRDSLGTALPTEAVSRHDTISTNSSTATVRALDDVVKSEKQSKLGADENGSPGYFDVPKRRLKRAANGDSPISKQAEAPQDRRIFTAPAIVNRHNQRVTLQYSPKEHSHESFRRSYEGFRRISDDASDRSLQSTPSPDNSRFVPSPPASKAARKLLQEQATDAVKPLPQPGPTEFLTPDRARKAESVKSRASDRTEDIRRPSMDHDRTSPVFLHTGRTSFDRATLYTSRYRDASQTPYSQHSQVSGVSDGLEVHEATAMAIYPHNNNSLVVVQQVARDGSLSSSGNQTFTTAGPSMSQANLFGNSLSPPALMFNDKPLPIPKEEPPTPPILMFNDKPLPTPRKFDDDDDALDFALENPRTPPLPPALNVIPPTPHNDNESDSKDPDRPSRRQSLTKKARRYSDSLIQPVLERTATITKRMNITLPQRRQSLSGKDVLEKQNALHPFWRPRGFWDDFASDSDEDYDNIDAMPIGRLPKGGDTSNVGAEETQRQRIAALGRRLTNGFKGSGGFLIGNSLGVERAGSNARRHHIQLPSVPMADVRAGLRSGLVKTSTGLGRAKATTLERAGVLARRIGRFEGRIMKQRSQATLRHNVHQPDNTAVTNITSTTSPPPQPPNNDHDAALVDAADHRPTVITTITTSSPHAKATPTLRTESSIDLALSGGAGGVSRFSTASTSTATAGPVQTDEVDIEQQYEDFRRAREQARQKWHAYHDRKNKFKDPERGRSAVATGASTSDTAGATAANDSAPGGTRRRRSLSLPGTRWGVEYVGLTGLREKLAEARSERRRDRLRGSIRVRPVEREGSGSSHGGRDSLGWGSVWGAGGGAAGGTSATR